MNKQTNKRLILTASLLLLVAGQPNLVQAADGADKQSGTATAVKKAVDQKLKQQKSKEVLKNASDQKQKQQQTEKTVKKAGDQRWPSPQDARGIKKRPDQRTQNRPTFRARDNYRSRPAPPSYRDRDYRRSSRPAWDNRRGSQRPPWVKKRKKKKSWFSTDRFSDAWDDMLDAPSDMGEMPGGWTAPSVSMPNPVDVGEEFEDAAKDAPDQMRDVYDDNRRTNDGRRPYYRSRPDYRRDYRPGDRSGYRR